MIRVEGGGRRVADVAGLTTYLPFLSLSALVAGSRLAGLQRRNTARGA